MAEKTTKKTAKTAKEVKTLEQLRESFDHRYEDLPDRFLVGAIDSHVHAGPVEG